MPPDDGIGPYFEAIRRGFDVARALGQGCQPVHLLVGLAEGHGAAAAALDPGQGRSLREVVTTEAGTAGTTERTGATPGAGSVGGSHQISFLTMQAQRGASRLAASRRERVRPEHLLIALLDQATTPVLRALDQAGLDPDAVREMAATAIGRPGLPPIELPAPTPAGTLDRPPLPVEELDARAWGALSWRQQHLPLAKVHGPSGRDALLNLERAEAWRLADRLGLGDDQRYSLISLHASAVTDRVDAAKPGLGRAPSRDGGRAMARAMRRRSRPRGPHRARAFTLSNVTIGWGVWFGNRRVSLRDRWFRLRTLRDYRGAPQV